MQSTRPPSLDIFDVELSGEDVEAITALNRDERTGPDPGEFDLIPSGARPAADAESRPALANCVISWNPHPTGPGGYRPLRAV